MKRVVATNFKKFNPYIKNHPNISWERANTSTAVRTLTLAERKLRDPRDAISWHPIQQNWLLKSRVDLKQAVKKSRQQTLVFAALMLPFQVLGGTCGILPQPRQSGSHPRIPLPGLTPEPLSERKHGPDVCYT